MSNIRGYSPPNDTTVGAVGDIYTDIDDGVEYKCVGVHEVKSDTVTTYYSWVRVNTGSGSGGGTDEMPSGGGGKEWRHIRTVTIPEDITTDTSGVNFVAGSDGGAQFGFDTDENGNPFELTELFIAYEAGYYLSDALAYVLAVNNGIPAWVPSGGVNMPIRVQGDAHGFSKGWAKYENCGGNGYAIGTSLQTGFTANYGVFSCVFKAVSLVPNITNTKTGFKVGSKFEIYGR